MKKLGFLAVLLGCLLFTGVAFAQQGDAMFSLSTVGTPSNNGCQISSLYGIACPESGGLYTGVGADVIFHRRMGVGFDIDWRATQGYYGGSGGEPYRPIQFDFNGVYQPKLGKKLGADVFGGIGWQSTRFYTNQYSCGYFSGCINYNTSTHFLIDAGVGLRYYVWGHFFVRPEARYYYVNNNTNDFTSNNLFRVGASIGYTIGPD
ncbi:MAG TPA: outer membrane beta-barrel protein [Verrucomicrobiae bacterium]|nr:outer membrane beta-barrel protein [Verrucomicrobiae bacterium]